MIQKMLRVTFSEFFTRNQMEKTIKIGCQIKKFGKFGRGQFSTPCNSKTVRDRAWREESI